MRTLAVLGLILTIALTGCGGSEEDIGQQLRLTETYDQVRAGARLILKYDQTASAFVGTVTNTTSGTLSQVRVEVHLSNGAELGPTTPSDLAPGETRDVTLSAVGQTFTTFTTWVAHAEVGAQGASAS